MEGLRKRGVDVLVSGRIVAFVGSGLIFLAALIGPPPNPLFFQWDVRSASRLVSAGSLDPSFLREVWTWNLAAFPSILASDFLLATGLCCVAYVSWVLTKVTPFVFVAYRATGGLSAKLIFFFFCAGAVIPAVGFLQNLGSTTAGNYIFTSNSASTNVYSFDSVLVALQVSYLVSVGRSVWIQALLYVLLGGGFWLSGFLGIVHSSELRAIRLPRHFKWHSLFGLILGFVGFVVFIVDVCKFFVPYFSYSYAVATVFYLVLMIPAWTVWLGILLPTIPSEFMKGTVVVQGPAYAELNEARVGGGEDLSSVEMEEQPRRDNTSSTENTDDLSNTNNNNDIVEIDLEE